jgi:hypothetical protein
VAGGLELLQRRTVQGDPAALIYDFPIPVEAETLQGAQDAIRTARYDAGSVEILDPQQPLATVVAGIEVASDGCQKRAEVQITRRGGGEAPYVKPCVQ